MSCGSLARCVRHARLLTSFRPDPPVLRFCSVPSVTLPDPSACRHTSFRQAHPSSPRPYLPVPRLWIDPINVWPPFRKSSSHAPTTWRERSFPPFRGRSHPQRWTTESTWQFDPARLRSGTAPGQERRRHAPRSRQDKKDGGTTPWNSPSDAQKAFVTRVEDKTVGRPFRARWTSTNGPLPRL